MAVTMLGSEPFAAARRFVETNARPLESARLRRAFDGAPAAPVLDELGRYRNPDGGFGHALEPDLRAPQSSALCTSVVFQTLRSLGVEPDHMLVSGGIAYLMQTLDREEGHWRIVPPAAGASAHAPWWNQTGREEALGAFSLNPTAELLGYLYDYQQLVPDEVIEALTEKVLCHLAGLEEIEMHDLLCVLRLLTTASLPKGTREEVRRLLTPLVHDAVARDPGQWRGYSLRPLQVVESPDSPFHAGLEGAVAANLDFEIAEQNEDGSWAPTWSWGDAYPEEWPGARREWSGVITVGKLLLLDRFDRIDRV